MKKLVYVFIVIIIFSIRLNSETIDKNLLPELFSPTNAGKEFSIGFIPVYFNAFDNYNKVILYFSSSLNANVRVRIPKAFIDTTIIIKPNEVGELALAAKYAISEPKQTYLPTLNERLYDGRGIIVTADTPIILYALARFRDYSEGFLGIPNNALSTDYNINTFPDYSNNTNNYAPSTVVIAAAFDNTNISFKLGGNDKTKIKLPKGDSLISGETYLRTLNKGDLWVLYGANSGNDLSGSFIKGNKPIAVFSGNYCAQVPVNLQPCEYLIEQELPIQSYANRYFITPIKGRKQGSIVKVTSQSPISIVKLNDVLKDTIFSITGIERFGYLSFRVNTNNAPAVISSDKRINVTQYNTGNQSVDDKGIPFKLQALSDEHFSNTIKFNLPATRQSEYFLANYLNIILKLDANGNIPEDITLTEFNNGVPTVKFLKDIAKDEPIAFPVTEEDGTRYYNLTLELPNVGSYVLRSQAPIGAVMYGSTLTDSYAMPAGIKLINNFRNSDKTAPIFDITEYQFGNFTGTITDMPPQSSLRSNLALIHLIKDSSFNFDFSYDEITPGVNQVSTFDLRPTNISYPAQAYMRAVDYAGNDTIIKFTYSNKPIFPKITIDGFEDSSLCPQKVYNIKYDVSESQFQSDNKFRVKLGKINPDRPGFPITIGEVSGMNQRNVPFTIPFNLTSDEDYYIYIEGTIPTVSSDTVFTLKVQSMPDLSINGYSQVFSSNPYTYSTSVNDVKYKWSVENGVIVGDDNSNSVTVEWNNFSKGLLSLEYSSDNNCIINKELNVNIKQDNGNTIEGPDFSCLNDEVFYNSRVNNGIFEWVIQGGEIIGNKEGYLIRVKWNKTGSASIKLKHTDTDGFVKELLHNVEILDIPSKPAISAVDSILTSSSNAGNQWFFEGQMIVGARARTYNAGTNEGLYTVQVTESGCKSDYSDSYNYRITTVRMKDQLAVTLYPNPAIDELNIYLEDSSISTYQFSICNYMMQEIDTFTNNNEYKNLIKYSTSKLSTGTYYVKLTKNADVQYYKFIVIR